MDVLQGLGVPSHAIEDETSEMETVVFAATANRSVLSSMNDHRHGAEAEARNPHLSCDVFNFL